MVLLYNNDNKEQMKIYFILQKLIQKNKDKIKNYYKKYHEKTN